MFYSLDNGARVSSIRSRLNPIFDLVGRHEGFNTL